ncbi:MAG: uroporphyrinogen-III synthase [Gemmatimonadetes bacterium]|nr:uroporphyrinogen-III synthase [Gemmatimonadota bacterium]
MSAGPLKGRLVVVTRPVDRAGTLVAALEAEGAEVVLFPTIEVVAPENSAQLADAAARVAEYDWVVFTSVYAVRALRDAASPVAAKAPRVGCVGEATAAEAEQAGFVPTVTPEGQTAADLARTLVAAGVGPGSRILFPKAADAREELPRILRDGGAVVDEVVAYRKVAVGGPPDATVEALLAGREVTLTFTAPSTVRNFVRSWGGPVGAARVVVIGPTTAAAAEAAGMRVSAVAEESTTAGLVRAVIHAFEPENQSDDTGNDDG